MTRLEEFDIRESFDALDDEKLGLLSMDQFYTLYLGLGYEPKVTVEEMNARLQRVRQDEDEEEEEEEKVTVEAAIKVLSKVSRTGRVNLFACIRTHHVILSEAFRISLPETGRPKCRQFLGWSITRKMDSFLPKILNDFPSLLGSQCL
jgi:hypothetical protein